jgi:hypothetical protein
LAQELDPIVVMTSQQKTEIPTVSIKMMNADQEVPLVDIHHMDTLHSHIMGGFLLGMG